MNNNNYTPQQPFVVTPIVPIVTPAKGLAIASLVLGIISFVTILLFPIAILLGILAIIFACVAKSKGNKGGMGTSGLVLGILSTTLAFLVLIAAIIVPSMLSIANNSREQVDLANAHSVYSAAQATYVEMKAAGNTPTQGTYYSTDSTLPAFTKAVINNLGASYTKDFKIFIGTNGVISATYNGTTYTPSD